MKSKSFGLFTLSIFALILIIGGVSAVSLTAPSQIILTKSNTSKTLTITADTAGDNFNITNENFVPITDFNKLLHITDEEEHSAVVTVTNISELNNTNSVKFNVSVGDFSNFELGDSSNTLTIYANSNETNITKSIDIILRKEFYDGSNDGDLNIRNFDFDVLEGFGDDEKFWYPLDEVQVSFEVDNQGDWDVENIEITACLYDKTERKCVMDERDMDLSDDDFDLNENEETRIELTFQIEPDDLNRGNKDYAFYVSATGQIDDSDADDLDGEKTGVSDSKDIEIRQEEFLVLDDAEIPETVQCDSEARIMAKIWNIGDNQIDEEDIYIFLHNSQLGISKVIDFQEDISELDYEVLDTIVEIPSDAEEKTYVLQVEIYDDSDLDENDLYENSEEDTAEYNIFLEVQGNCQVQDRLTISASLESDARAGKPLEVRVTLTNLEDETKSYVLSASGYESWASDVELPETLILESGESDSGLLTLNVNKGVSGEKEFDIEVISGSEVIAVQPFKVTIQESGFFSGLTGSVIAENPYLIGLGIINILIIIGIIILAIRLGKK